MHGEQEAEEAHASFEFTRRASVYVLTMVMKCCTARRTATGRFLPPAPPPPLATADPPPCSIVAGTPCVKRCSAARHSRFHSRQKLTDNGQKQVRAQSDKFFRV